MGDAVSGTECLVKGVLACCNNDAGQRQQRPVVIGIIY
jgi:hypothetical protein